MMKQGMAHLSLTCGAILLLSAVAGAVCLEIPGDVNGSGATNISDVQCTQLISIWSLGGGTGPIPSCLFESDLTRADLNCDLLINIQDVQLGVQYATGSLLPELDMDGDNCPDNCGVAAMCGDGTCDAGENCVGCPDDCGLCAGACCNDEETPGCEEPQCESCVCALDPFCCESTWDFICATEALEDCDAFCGCPGPFEGSCCSEHTAPGCASSDCASCVCTVDSFCCSSSWDEACTTLAAGDCNESCECVVSTTGSCCAENATPGCEFPACNACVCSDDPQCCDVAWDIACVSSANSSCVNSCQCENTDNSCCSVNALPGCNDSECEALICTQDPFCCESTWDSLCVEAAFEYCGPVCGGAPACPGGGGDCCSENGSAGCGDVDCCETVCEQDAFCCDVIWDELCVSAALELCEDPCDPTPAACGPDAGDCCNENGSTGCADSACCTSVCDADPFCCEVTWDGVCAGAALELCPDVCGEPSVCQAATGPCMEPKDSGLGCDDVECCETVCANDPFCCETVWDAVCAAEAMLLCPGMAPESCGVGTQNCCGVGDDPGCADLECCVAVCASDAFCCEVTWDAVCVNQAADACSDSCETAVDSCVGHCGSIAPSGCGCGSACIAVGDCCLDSCEACGFCAED